MIEPFQQIEQKRKHSSYPQFFLLEVAFLIEYDQTENGLREHLTYPKVKMTDGMIKVPTGPGLGLEVNEDVLMEYATSEKKLNGTIY